MTVQQPGATYFDLINAVDSFPHHIDIGQTPNTPIGHEDASTVPAYYQFLLPNDPRPHGFISPAVVTAMPWTPDFIVSAPNAKPRTVRLSPTGLKAADGTLEASRMCNDALHGLLLAACASGNFPFLTKTPGSTTPATTETMRILGASGQVQVNRFAAPLFGIATRGAHMTVFVKTTEGLKIWIPRRAAHLYSYPGKLDTSVAGGVRAEETPFECIIHEAEEEASLPKDLVRERARPAGEITYVSLKRTSDLGDLMMPDCVYVFDMELLLDENIEPRPCDDEVETFELWDVPKIKEAMRNGEFKPNAAVVMIDFFIRHGIITPENEKDYVQICGRLRRELPVPLSPPS